MGLNVLFNDFSYEILPKQKETFDKYCKIIQWGRRNPTRFLEQFVGVSLTDHQKYIIMSSWIPSNVTWLCSRATGKATSLDTKVWTINRDEKLSCTTVGELKKGDKIYDSQGKLSEVVSLNPIIFDEYYEIKFSDGEIIKCNGEHLWLIYCNKNKSESPILLETKILYEVFNKNAKDQAKDFYIPLSKPLENVKEIDKNVDFNGDLTFLNYLLGKNNLFNGMDRKAIIDIHKVSTKIPMRCITMGNSDGTFLCGDNFTVTHNSFMISLFIMAKTMLFPSFKTYIMAPTGQQAQETFTKLEDIAKNNISSVVGVTPVFLDEAVRMNSKADPFTHDKSGYHVELFNGSEINTLNSVAKNIVGIRSNLNRNKCSRIW